MSVRSSAVLEKHFLDLSKQLLREIDCDWIECDAVLCSWNSFQKHMSSHCHHARNINKQYECQYKLCSARFHASQKELETHINLSHLSRSQLECPIKGCKVYFPHHQRYIRNHIQDSHNDLYQRDHTLLDVNQLKPSSNPISPSKTKHSIIAPLPQYPPNLLSVIPLYITQHRGHSALMSTRSDMISLTDPYKEVLEEFEDLDSTWLKVSWQLSKTYQAAVEKQSRGPLLQLSRPYPRRIGSEEDAQLPVTIGYNAFSLQFSALEAAGLVKGNGEWPMDPRNQVLERIEPGYSSHET